MDYILVDSNGGKPKVCDDWKCADWLVFNTLDFDEFESSWRIGHEDDEHLNTKRALRCFAEIRTRYPGAIPGYHPYADTGFKSGVGQRVAALRKDDGYYTVNDLDGIKTHTRMEVTQVIWHVWVDIFLRGDPVSVWIAHARNLGKYFVANMELPAEEAEAQKYEHMGKAAIRNAEHSARKTMEKNGTNGEHEDPANAKLVFNDYKTGDKVNVGALPACDIRIYPNKNWNRIVKWNPKDPFKIQDWLEFNSNWAITVI